MKTRILPLAALAAALAGCVHENEASIQFYAVCYPPEPDGTTGACVYPESCDAVALGTFWADVGFLTQPLQSGIAVAPIEIRNQLLSNADDSVGRVNTNIAYIQQFHLEFFLGDVMIAEEWVDANVTVPTAGTTVALVPLVPLNTAFTLLGLIGPPPLAASVHLMVNVRAAGTYADERVFETGPFKVPVDVCDGCYTAPSCGLTALLACPQEGQYAFYACAQ